MARKHTLRLSDGHAEVPFQAVGSRRRKSNVPSSSRVFATSLTHGRSHRINLCKYSPTAYCPKCIHTMGGCPTEGGEGVVVEPLHGWTCRPSKFPPIQSIAFFDTSMMLPVCATDLLTCPAWRQLAEVRAVGFPSIIFPSRTMRRAWRSSCILGAVVSFRLGRFEYISGWWVRQKLSC